MTARLLVTEQKPSVGWSQRQDSITNTKPRAQMRVNQHVRAPWKPVKVRCDFEHAIFLKLKIGVSLGIGLQPCLVAVALDTASSLR